MIGDNFNPEVGFVRRDDIRRLSGEARFSPRPARCRRCGSSPGPSAAGISRTAPAGSRRGTRAEIHHRFETSDRIGVITITSNVRVRAAAVPDRAGCDGACWRLRRRRSVRLTYQRRRTPPTVRRRPELRPEHGTFYDGRKTSVGVSTRPGHPLVRSLYPSSRTRRSTGSICLGVRSLIPARSSAPA